MEDNTRKYLTDNIKQHNRLRTTLREVGSNSFYPKYLINTNRWFWNDSWKV